jgi:hypothetical protein
MREDRLELYEALKARPGLLFELLDHYSKDASFTVVGPWVQEESRRWYRKTTLGIILVEAVLTDDGWVGNFILNGRVKEHTGVLGSADQAMAGIDEILVDFNPSMVLA